MYDESYYSNKIKELQKKKRKAHNKEINTLYKKVGHHFVQTESKKKITKDNYSNFTYINKKTLNELKKVANTMQYRKGSWILHLNNYNNFYNWFAKTFRDDKQNNNFDYKKNIENKNNDQSSTNNNYENKLNNQNQ